MDIPKYTDVIQPVFSASHAGKNYKNPRLNFYEPREITVENNFLNLSSEAVSGEWWNDAGDIAMPEADREPRVICRKGKASFTINGPTAIVRVMVNPGFGSADVRIDGVLPSSISGVQTPMDVLSCDSEDNGSVGNEYFDIILADNLSAGEHTVELYCENTDTGTGGYVPLAGFKERRETLDLDIDAWLLPFGSGQNLTGISFMNVAGKTVRNLEITFASGLLDSEGVQVATFSKDPVNTATTEIFQFTPQLSEVVPGEVVKEIGISAEYEDPAGAIPYYTTVTMGSHDTTSITYSAGWVLDTANGENRAFSDLAGKTASFSFSGDSLTVRVQKDCGWGNLEVRVDGVLKATIDCHDADGGGFYTDVTITGLGSGSHTGQIKNKQSLPAPFSSISYVTTKNYSLLEETLSLNYQVADVPPFAPEAPELISGDLSFIGPSSGSEDLSIPRSNNGLSKVRAHCRFPTFAVYYANGKEDVLSQYDLVVLDPHGVTRQQIARLQAKGIKVLLYVSFGEEDGTIANPYQPSSEKCPWTGDGTGPGGYAGYYCKGGNRFGEQSECEHDCQRLLGSKTCAKSREEYYTGTGRCSPVCQKDWRTGYSVYDAGGECGGGKTKSDFWVRTASVGCKNASCPAYAPIHQGCSDYSQAQNCWGQDLSIGDQVTPDENGIWGSYFIDATKPGWGQRLRDYYLPSVFGQGVANFMTPCVVTSQTTDNGTGPCIRVPTYPIDSGEPVEVRNALGYLFTSGRDYSFDAKLGTFSMTPATELGAPSVSVGDTLYVTYTRLGLEADGLFMDTVDSVDVYPSPEYQAGMANLINALKSEYPEKLFCSNRGFTILESIIASCNFVMFESFLSDYNWETDVYSLITDSDAIAFNNGIIDQLKTLRRKNIFDVLALNYCHNGSAGNTLRQQIYDRCRELGFLCWTSTILLNDPEAVQTITSSGKPIRSNVWRKIREAKA